MTVLVGSESSSRGTWTAALLDLIQRPNEASRQLQAASLLQLFASPTQGAAIEAVLLDGERDPWIRTYVMRAMGRRSIPITDEGFRALLREFADELVPPAARRWPRHLAEIDGVASAVALARSPEQRAEAASFLWRLEGSVARELLLMNTYMADRLDAEMSEVVYRRCIEAGVLDRALAWATLEQPASRAIVFGAGADPDLDELDQAIERVELAAIDAIFADHPQIRAAALDAMCLPVEYLVQHRPHAELRRAALRMVRDLGRSEARGETGPRRWRPLQVLFALPTAAQDLDALLEDPAVGESVRGYAASLRLRCSPPPRFDALPEQSVAGRLEHASPGPEDRPLLAWALESPHAAYRYAGLHGLVTLDDGRLEPAVIARFRGGDEPLSRLVALGAAAREGDRGAVEELARAARDAPHVLLRARALRALRTSSPLPGDYVDLCRHALTHDREIYDLYYAPAQSEAALGLARHAAIEEGAALEALVEAGLSLTNDETWWAIEAAIGSWLDHSEARIRPFWYGRYLSGA